MSRRAIAYVVLLVTSITVSLAPGAAMGAPCWRTPVVGEVVDPFRPPACPYCAGNRGLEFAIAPGSAVRAVASGVVSWAGAIAGVRWIVVLHGNGDRVTYGRMDISVLRQGDRVVRGSTIGTAGGEFYFGVRVGERYVDPAPYLGRLVGRPRLVPIDGSSPRTAPAPTLRCGV